jgi:hypothetical protein
MDAIKSILQNILAIYLAILFASYTLDALGPRAIIPMGWWLGWTSLKLVFLIVMIYIGLLIGNIINSRWKTYRNRNKEDSNESG